MRFWVLYNGATPVAKATCNEDNTEGVAHLQELGYTEVTQQEFDSATISNYTESSTMRTLQSENKLLKAQLQAQTERSDFIEDCIAEMATQVYGGV